MAKLVWDSIGTHLFEAGVSNGVLYLDNRVGVAWNGITSVNISSSDNIENIFYDGQKLSPYVGEEDFSASITAITYPDAFSNFNGELELDSGITIAAQNVKYFHLSYKTILGNDVDGLDYGYRIHILYNLLASPSESQYNTISDSTSVIDFQWDLTSKPEVVSGYRPTAHVMIDSNRIKPEILEYVEGLLYGTATSSPTIPSLDVLAKNVINWGLIIITDNGDGTWTASGPDEYFTMINSTTFEITNINGSYLNANTYQISSSIPD